MLAIPFGFIGAVLGHLLLRIPLTLESYVALFAVGGIVINDSLILVEKLMRFGKKIFHCMTLFYWLVKRAFGPSF
ncbi:MAG: efflux RND transporter permease subunit [Rhodospirillaceae bacterium]|nr:efflux RND transporter permease subunit [Rhodospirillaceae bacterium]